MGLAKILPGILIIAKYEPDADTAAEHDEFYCGGKVSKDLMTAEEKKTMKSTGWTYDTDYESWKRFV